MVAKELGVDMSIIKIKPTMNVTNPNGSTTGGSVGSEMNCAVSTRLFYLLLKLIILTFDCRLLSMLVLSSTTI